MKHKIKFRLSEKQIRAASCFLSVQNILPFSFFSSRELSDLTALL